MSTSLALEQYSLLEIDDELGLLRTEMENLMKDAKSPNTVKAYENEWRSFMRWCGEHGRRALPTDPQTIALFVTSEARSGYSLITIRLGLAAIDYFHASYGYPSPRNEMIRKVVAGIAHQQARTRDPNQRAGKDALQVAHLQKICRTLRDDDRIDVRDKSIILVGFASAWRRSELKRLNVDDVTIDEHGATLRLAYSKSDQEGKGRVTVLRYGDRPYTCPVRALEAWLKVRGKSPGPLFVRFTPHTHEMTMNRLGGQGICSVLKRAIERIGESPKAYGAHSLRSGMITAADAKRVSLKDIMEHTQHARVDTLMRYIKPRHANPLAGVL